MTKSDLTEPQAALLNDLAFSHPGHRVPLDIRVANNLVDKGFAVAGSQPGAFRITEKGLNRVKVED